MSTLLTRALRVAHLPAARSPGVLLQAVWLSLALLLPAAGAQAQEALGVTTSLKLVGVTTHAQEGDYGYAHAGDDTAEQNALTLRVNLDAQPTDWLNLRLDYQNVKLHSATATAQAQGSLRLFRAQSLRWTIEEPETSAAHSASGQQVAWYHELDWAYARATAGSLRLTLGRQPLSWGVGRIWQPTTLFAAFSPTELDTEYKPGVDAALLDWYPGAFSSVSVAHVAHDTADGGLEDSTVLHTGWNTEDFTAFTAMAGQVLGQSVVGGSVELTWLDAGWRLEAVSWQDPAAGPDEEDSAVQAVAGVDYQFPSETIVVAELYQDSRGALRAADLPQVAALTVARQGRLQQLSARVLALSASQQLSGLWNGSYTVFASPLSDAEGSLQWSALHQAALTYSVADNAEAVFSLLHGDGRGLDAEGAPRSEFGALPDSLYVKVSFVF